MVPKLEDNWIGPYEITKCLDKDRVKLKKLKSGNTLTNTYNTINLNVYNNSTNDNEKNSERVLNVEEL